MKARAKLYITIKDGNRTSKGKSIVEEGGYMQIDDNVLGLSDTQQVDNLRSLIRRQSPMVFLTETNCTVVGMEESIGRLGNFMGTLVDYRGKAGGLSLVWERSINARVLSKSPNHIDKGWPVEVEWRFKGVYGWPKTGEKLRTCDMIRDLKMQSTFPWVVSGDTNEILHNFQMKGGTLKNQNVQNAFYETFNECGLFDLGFSGYECTWENRKRDGEVVEDRLDRLCALVDWSAIFPVAWVTHLNENISDHMLLSLAFMDQPRRARKRGKV
ncbi:LOW QUALITY PROTEIN: hypothetical protein Cgig2_024058 [Carnegiea gigantea]|uniref:Endonuclease/exonuclease/phosphatase domain-containing protein n=1 Tax=Carnegiea gigantea TaxID=171969 RepID=A0A9Q1QJU5_9CARY|nr:LOW QUALITY PROTEIN: hypothetical protein Cgig2_024058 [Carnegiea gigantea]